jgi:hypothetical protein
MTHFWQNWITFLVIEPHATFYLDWLLRMSVILLFQIIFWPEYLLIACIMWYIGVRWRKIGLKFWSFWGWVKLCYWKAYFVLSWGRLDACVICFIWIRHILRGFSWWISRINFRRLFLWLWIGWVLVEVFPFLWVWDRGSQFKFEFVICRAEYFNDRIFWYWTKSIDFK